MMDCFIKKIAEGKTDKYVHLQFQKFSKGVFTNKAMINASFSANKYRLNTGPEYSNELVRIFAEKMKEGEKTKVKGIIVSTRDLEGELDYQGRSQFMGVKKYSLDKEMKKEEILNLCDELPLSFIGLSFAVGESELKIKEKMPKSSKPKSKSEEKPKADFCKIITKELDLVNNLIFDFPKFKKISINHEFIVEELEIPKNEKDFVKMRENTIRKGKVKRIIEVDGKELEREFSFEA